MRHIHSHTPYHSDYIPFTANGQPISEEEFQNIALDINKNIIIEACAGSGKTWLLVVRLLKLLLNGVDAKQIVAITFTRKAAQEMKIRLADLLDTLNNTAHDYSINQSNQPNQSSSESFKKGYALLQTLNYPLNNTTSHFIQTVWERCYQQNSWPDIVTFHEWFGELRNNAPLSSLETAGAVLNKDESLLQQQAWQQFWHDTHTHANLKQAMHSSVLALGLKKFESYIKAMLNRRAEWWVYAEKLQDYALNNTVNETVNTNTIHNTDHNAKYSSIYAVNYAETLANLAQKKFIATLNIPDISELQKKFNALLPDIDLIINLYRISTKKTAIKRVQLLEETLNKTIQTIATHDKANIKTTDSIPFIPTDTFHKLVNRLLINLSGQVSYKDMHKAIIAHPKYQSIEFFENSVRNVCTALKDINGYLITLNKIPVHAALLHCGAHWLANYQALKQTQGYIDFTDLELDALRLLRPKDKHTESLAILSRFNIAIQHLLLDEFQDTNPVQWQALQAFLMPLLQETQAGGQPSSVFIVGDPKQSIYQFRRADPKLFNYVKTQLHQTCNAILLKTQQTRRNAMHINEWINAVFTDHNSDKHVNNHSFTTHDDSSNTSNIPNISNTSTDTTDTAINNHSHSHSNLFSKQFTLKKETGLIYMLPVVSALNNSLNADDPPIDENWVNTEPILLTNTNSTIAADTNFSNHLKQSPAILEAKQVLHALKSWKSRSPNLPWSQAMVLARKHESLQTIAQLLKQAGIESIRSDKGGFFKLPEIIDSLSILQALSNPKDELAILNALRTPIFAITDTQLSELLALRNTVNPSIDASSNRLHSPPPLQTDDWLGLAKLHTPWAINTVQWLTLWQSLCHRLPIHDALDTLFHQGRWIERLSAIYSDHTDSVAIHLAQLLHIALQTDKGRYPSLRRFMQAIAKLKINDSTGTESSIHTNAVRLSTIHGAKGLEADCVCLIDLYSKPSNTSQTATILLDWSPENSHPDLFAIPLWDKTTLSKYPSLHYLVEEHEHIQNTERDTLLYVAMTRAVNELWCSAQFKKNADSNYVRLETAYTRIQSHLNRSIENPIDTTAYTQTIHNTLLSTLSPLSEQTAPILSVNHTPNPIDDTHQRQAWGTFVHQFFEYLLRTGNIPNHYYINRWAIALNIATHTATELVKASIKMANHTQLLQLRSLPYSYLALEENLCYIDDNHDTALLLRPDIVIYFYKSDYKQLNPIESSYTVRPIHTVYPIIHAWIIDFKLSFDINGADNPSYATQLSQYVHALKQSNINCIDSYLLTLSNECWQLMPKTHSNKDLNPEKYIWNKVNIPWIAYNSYPLNS